MGQFVRHGPCDKCGSSDANAVYEDGSTYCWSCKTSANGDGVVRETTPRNTALIQELTYQALTARRLTEDSCRRWNYGVGQFKGKPVQVANYFDRDGTRIVKQKVRFPDKDFLMLGETKDQTLYGQHLWRDGGKMLVVTEGEIDAISLSQCQGHKWPVVSIPNGAQAAKKSLLANSDWLDTFDHTILMFDMDEPGRAAAVECADALTPGKVKIATLPLKDANDMLKAGREQELLSAIWNARTHRPDGIVAGTEIWDRMMAVPNADHAPYPWVGLNNLVLGARKGEIITFTAGTGVGKSEVVGHIAHHFLAHTNETVGYVALEETVEETAFRLCGIDMGHRLLVNRDGVPLENIRASYDQVVGNGRLYLYDHWGSTDSDNLMNKIRFLARGCGCTTIVLDHISIVVSGMTEADGNERRLIDNTMTKLASMVKELNVRLILISHLRKPDGTPHEEGGRVTLDHLRGSASLKQLSWDIIALERNQQDETLNQHTHVRVLKCRRTGRTGSACWLKYDQATGRMAEVADPNTFAPTPAETPETNKDF